MILLHMLVVCGTFLSAFGKATFNNAHDRPVTLYLSNGAETVSTTLLGWGEQETLTTSFAATALVTATVVGSSNETYGIFSLPRYSPTTWNFLCFCHRDGEDRLAFDVQSNSTTTGATDVIIRNLALDAPTQFLVNNVVSGSLSDSHSTLLSIVQGSFSVTAKLYPNASSSAVVLAESCNYTLTSPVTTIVAYFVESFGSYSFILSQDQETSGGTVSSPVLCGEPVRAGERCVAQATLILGMCVCEPDLGKFSFFNSLQQPVKLQVPTLDYITPLVSGSQLIRFSLPGTLGQNLALIVVDGQSNTVISEATLPTVLAGFRNSIILASDKKGFKVLMPRTEQAELKQEVELVMINLKAELALQYGVFYAPQDDPWLPAPTAPLDFEVVTKVVRDNSHPVRVAAKTSDMIQWSDTVFYPTAADSAQLIFYVDDSDRVQMFTTDPRIGSSAISRIVKCGQFIDRKSSDQCVMGAWPLKTQTSTCRCVHGMQCTDGYCLMNNPVAGAVEHYIYNSYDHWNIDKSSVDRIASTWSQLVGVSKSDISIYATSDKIRVRVIGLPTVEQDQWGLQGGLKMRSSQERAVAVIDQVLGHRIIQEKLVGLSNKKPTKSFPVIPLVAGLVVAGIIAFLLRCFLRGFRKRRSSSGPDTFTSMKMEEGVLSEEPSAGRTDVGTSTPDALSFSHSQELNSTATDSGTFLKARASAWEGTPVRYQVSGSRDNTADNAV